jgi:hypothetical protein
MEITIELSPKDWQCLSNHVPHNWAAHAALTYSAYLRESRQIPSRVVIPCTDLQAEEILEVAEADCGSVAETLPWNR